MEKRTIKFIYVFGLLVFVSTIFNLQNAIATPVFEHLTVLECDSLINANSSNPNFVVLDVRTVNEYNPQHLQGAINRNYYNPNFSNLLSALDTNKTYLIHCASGGRSGNVFNLMQTMSFTKVYNMIGGMNAWNAQSLPSTNLFAPLLMFISDTVIPNQNIELGLVDTIEVKITNRANSTLSFLSITSLVGTEFSTDFDLNVTRQGAKDYAFNIFYEPIDMSTDTLNFTIESNGGDITLSVTRTGYQLMPELSFNSDTILDFNSVFINYTDSLPIVIRNSGLANLSFVSVNQLYPSAEFSIQFDIDTVLLPGEEYEAYVYYTPIDNVADSTIFSIVSNGGVQQILVFGLGDLLVEIPEVEVFDLAVLPNPANNIINIADLPDDVFSYSIFDISGKIIQNEYHQLNKTIDVSQLNCGVYVIKINTQKGTTSNKIIIER